MEKKSSYARNVFIQSMLYVGAFVLSWSWATVFHLVAWTTGVSVPWITLLINTFLPLQGFWNAFIYARPRYIRLKKQHAHLGCIDIVKLVFFPPKEGGVGGVGSRTTTRVNENVSTLRSAVDGDDDGDDRESGVFKSFMASMKRNKGMRTSSSSSFQDSQQTLKATGRARPTAPIEVVDEEQGDNDDGDKGEADEAKNAAAEDEWPENTPSPPASGEK